MPSGQRWSRDELLVAFRLYCHTPFGKLHKTNPEIVQLSNLIGRTPSALAMKACNFASMDPVHQARKVKGLTNVSEDDRKLWQEFGEQTDEVVLAADVALERLSGRQLSRFEKQVEVPDGPSEVVRSVTQRRLQSFFRSAVLASYEYKCAMTGINVPALLNASHIIPWRDNEAKRADPRNGIALNTLHDRAFDRGLLTFDESLRVVLSPSLRSAKISPYHQKMLIDMEGSELTIPHRFAPDPEALAYHREHVFVE